MLDGIGEGQILLADRAYDSDALRVSLKARGAWGCIKPMPNRKNIPSFSAFLYRQRTRGAAHAKSTRRGAFLVLSIGGEIGG